MIRIFIGYDSREAVAFNVLSHSIQTRASEPVEIVPLMLSQLRSVFKREAHPLQSTEFSFSRFLVPHLSQYEGWSLFCDCDMLMLDDLANLWKLRDETYAVQVVKHEHNPGETKKFLNKPQSRYEKKNWSSVILFNNAKCTALTPAYVNTATGLELHQFKWLNDDSLIGELPHRWNHLVDYDPTVPPDQVSLIHFTEGGPYFDDYKECSYADLWFAERERMLFAG
ncbi:MAG TPA: glycosyltransferase [Rhodospirillaceae bacterium]|nr:glycosyltransferase [Candidatus Neomarinimicrobiota bacterium]HCX15103.1 glycosyltransferase [Rhodospirillaceae bacterium]|tara:strand:+ start:454 stop:1128 length:675 start_codon:yes stop_codon:yes gene_type:complete